MKTMLMSAASLLIMCGTASARETINSSFVKHHATGILIEHRAAYVNSGDGECGVSCATKYFTKKDVDGIRTAHKSVDCEE